MVARVEQLPENNASPAGSRWRLTLREALTNPDSPAYGATMCVIVTLILLSVATLVAESMSALSERIGWLINAIEVLVVAGFTAEYVANIYAAENKRRYLTSFWGLVDLLAILPSYLSLIHVGAFKGLRTLRVLRVLRMLKLMKLATTRARQSNARALERRNTFSLDIQIYFIALFTAVVISSTLAFYAESSAVDTKFTSIPAAMWWAIVTVTTTGYGDMVPLTIVGRLVGAATMLSGVALISILTSVIGRAVLISLFGAAPEDEQRGRRQRTRARLGIGTAASTVSVAALPKLGAAEVGIATLPVAPPTRPSSPSYERAENYPRGARPSTLRHLLNEAFVNQSSQLFHVVSAVVTLLVFISVGLVILESVQSIEQAHHALFTAAEYVIVVAFTLEYVANLAATEHKREYALSFWGIVDLIAVLPTYLTIVNFTAVKIVRTLRILRVLRILKLTKLAAQNAQATARRRSNTFWLDLQIYLITLFTAIVLSSTLVFYAERDVPNSAYTDIPVSMWWAVVTITTTGYGDMAPNTVAGRVVGGVTMLTGLALFGILTSVIGRTMLSSLFGSADDSDEASARTGD